MADNELQATICRSVFKKTLRAKSVAGLRNFGNTCYLNATIQLINICSCLREFIVNIDWPPFPHLLQYLASILQDLGKKEVLRPLERMVFEMNNSFSREFAQQDVYHCLTYIMGAIDGFGRGMLDSLFEVKQQYVKQCQSCKSTLETFKFNGDPCTRCGSDNIDMIVDFSATPQYLLIHLNWSVGRNNSYDCLLQIDETLALGDRKYRLRGYSVHQGKGNEFGHYYSYVIDGKQSWLYCSDDSVKAVDKRLEFAS